MPQSSIQQYMLAQHCWRVSGSFWAIQACALCAAGVWRTGKQYLLLYALSLIDEAAIPDPCQVLHDELCCLRLACA